MRRTPICQLDLTFFGLTPSYRSYIFSQIHEIVFYGNGGYDWNTIYNMPIWLRNFTYNKIKEHYEKQNSENDTVEESINNMRSAGAVAQSPEQKVPSYVTKASKK